MIEAGGMGVRRSQVSGGQSMAHLATIGTSLHAVGKLSDGAGHIAVVFGHFDALPSRRLQQIVSEDQSLQIVGTDLDCTALEHTTARDAPRVAVLDEADVVEPALLEDLRVAQPAIGIVVLVYRPTVAYAMRLMVRGASCLAKNVSACLAKNVSAADILAAVYIAANGRCVFADGGQLV
jgi:DNA-binding NarL/FixJ family response regulator